MEDCFGLILQQFQKCNKQIAVGGEFHRHLAVFAPSLCPEIPDEMWDWGVRPVSTPVRGKSLVERKACLIITFAVSFALQEADEPGVKAGY